MKAQKSLSPGRKEKRRSELIAAGGGSCCHCLAAVLVAWVAMAAAGCIGAAPARPAGGRVAFAAAGEASGVAARRRVVLISLDGAGTETLHQLYRQGLLHGGGFERFFRDGEVAQALIPVDPTVTSTNHISLATGFLPEATGIVANQFHPGGARFGDRASGFEAPIGSETLWEAMRRQGRRVGVLAWPGADAKDARRRADWGLVWNDASDRDPELVTLSQQDWRPASGRAETLTAQVPEDDEVDPGRTIELYAVAGDPAGTIRYGCGGNATLPLRAGEWGRVSWELPTGGATAAWFKLVAASPDLEKTSLYVGGVYHTSAYPAEFAASVAARGLAWPGAPDDGDLAANLEGEPGIDLDTWTEQAEHMAAFMGGAWRLAAARSDWDLLMGYMPVIDEAGHRLLLLDARQPGFSSERRDALARAYLRVWQMVDAELGKFLASLDLTRTTVVVVSDHGMTPVHTAVDPGSPLAELGLPPPPPKAAGAAGGSPAGPGAAAGGSAGGGSAAHPVAYAIPDGAVAHVYLDVGGDAAAGARVLASIADRYAAWRVAGEAPIERIFRRAEAARIGLDHPNSGDLILFAREGFIFRRLPAGKTSVPAPVYGAHGFLNTHPDVQASYMAIGAGVGRRSSGQVSVTEVAPRVAAWLGIAPPRRQGAAPSEVPPAPQHRWPAIGGGVAGPRWPAAAPRHGPPAMSPFDRQDARDIA